MFDATRRPVMLGRDRPESRTCRFINNQCKRSIDAIRSAHPPCKARRLKTLFPIPAGRQHGAISQHALVSPCCISNTTHDIACNVWKRDLLILYRDLQ